jgi:hypothetical protein
VYRKFRATIASGMAGNRLPTAVSIIRDHVQNVLVSRSPQQGRSRSGASMLAVPVQVFNR